MRHFYLGGCSVAALTHADHFVRWVFEMCAPPDGLETRPCQGARRGETVDSRR